MLFSLILYLDLSYAICENVLLFEVYLLSCIKKYLLSDVYDKFPD